jgi:hypothetical protein
LQYPVFRVNAVDDVRVIDLGLTSSVFFVKNYLVLDPCAYVKGRAAGVRNVKLSFNLDEVLAFDWILETDFQRMILLSPEKFTPSFIKVYNFYLSETKK